jgi:hypothetical protein
MLNKKISFVPKSLEAENFVPRPLPARHYMPDWLKNMPAFQNNKMFISSSGQANLTAKMCPPFMDTFSFGYIQETWCDIYIEKDIVGNQTYFFSGSPEIISLGRNSNYKIEDPFNPHEFLWKVQWSPRLPKGYSTLYTHPINRDDLPFRTLSGIVDSDKHFFEKTGNHPFFIKKDFEGFIPKGTPMFQIIPFKRNDWTSRAETYDPNLEKEKNFLRSKFWGVYKSNFWTKKTFK